MRISDWLRPLAGRLSRTPTPRTRQRPRFRPRLEGLEDRLCLSGGLLDPTFGSGGIIHLPNATDNGAPAVAVQPDGKVVVAGQTGGGYLSVQRLNPDGSLDKTFNKTGSVTINSGAADGPQAVVLQPDGKIVVGGDAVAHNGTEEFLVARLNTNGTLDSTFGSKGLWLSPGPIIYQLAVLTDASHTTVTGIVASAPGEVLKLTPSGALDRSFGSGGVATIAGLLQDHGLAVSAAGEIYVAGSINPPSGNGTGFLAALTPAGALDPTFGGGAGYVLSPVGSLYSEFTAVAVQTVTVGGQSVSRLVVGGDGMDAPGADQQYLLVAAYTLDGALDTTFGSGGWFTTAGMSGILSPYMHSLALEADGSIVLGGQSASGSNDSEMLIGHLTPDGTADTSFGPNGTGFAIVQDGVSSDLLGLAIDPRNGDIVACGYTFTTSNAARQADILRLTAP